MRVRAIRRLITQTYQLEVMVMEGIMFTAMSATAEFAFRICGRLIGAESQFLKNIG
jgi:hypothetical protein